MFLVFLLRAQSRRALYCHCQCGQGGGYAFA